MTQQQLITPSFRSPMYGVNIDDLSEFNLKVQITDPKTLVMGINSLNLNGEDDYQSSLLNYELIQELIDGIEKLPQDENIHHFNIKQRITHFYHKDISASVTLTQDNAAKPIEYQKNVMVLISHDIDVSMEYQRKPSGAISICINTHAMQDAAHDYRFDVKVVEHGFDLGFVHGIGQQDTIGLNAVVLDTHQPDFALSDEVKNKFIRIMDQLILYSLGKVVALGLMVK